MKQFFVACLLLLSAYVSATAQTVSANNFPIEAQPWPEADALFRREPRWLGGDDAYSVDLGRNRVLWLFADSFIATSSAHTRRESKLIRNSLAIQTGVNPATAQIKFSWGGSHDKPESFFRESGKVWHWPGHGVRLGKTLLLFLMKVRAVKTGLGFEVFGWQAVTIDNPDDEPAVWRMRWLNSPANDFGVIVGSASVLQRGAYVYAFGAEEPGIHSVYVVRWPLAQAERGNLSAPEWWTGAEWIAQTRLRAKPPAVFTGGETEFTVHYEPRLQRFIEIQTEGFGAAELAVRAATDFTAAWSPLQKFFRPPEAARADALIYAGKAHPALRGADLVLTYVVNSNHFGTLVNDRSIYYPRFLKATIK